MKTLEQQGEHQRLEARLLSERIQAEREVRLQELHAESRRQEDRQRDRRRLLKSHRLRTRAQTGALDALTDLVADPAADPQLRLSAVEALTQVSRDLTEAEGEAITLLREHSGRVFEAVDWQRINKTDRQEGN